MCELMGVLSICVSDSVHTLTCALMLLNTDLHGHVSLRNDLSDVLMKKNPSIILTWKTYNDSEMFMSVLWKTKKILYDC